MQVKHLSSKNTPAESLGSPSLEKETEAKTGGEEEHWKSVEKLRAKGRWRGGVQ